MKVVKRIRKIIHRDGTQTILEVTREKHPVTNDEKNRMEIKVPQNETNQQQNTPRRNSILKDPKNSDGSHIQSGGTIDGTNSPSTFNPSGLPTNIDKLDPSAERFYSRNSQKAHPVHSASSHLQDDSDNDRFEPIVFTKDSKTYDKVIYDFVSESSSNDEEDPNKVIDDRFIRYVSQKRYANSTDIRKVVQFQLKEGIQMTPALKRIRQNYNHGQFNILNTLDKKSKSMGIIECNDIPQVPTENKCRSGPISFDDFAVQISESASDEQEDDLQATIQIDAPSYSFKYNRIKKPTKISSNSSESYSNEPEFTDTPQIMPKKRKYKPLFKPKKRLAAELEQPKAFHKHHPGLATEFKGSLEIPDDETFIKRFGAIRPKLKAEFEETEDFKKSESFPAFLDQNKNRNVIQIDDKYYVEKIEDGFLTRVRVTADGRRLVLVSKEEKKRSPSKKLQRKKSTSSADNIKYAISDIPSRDSELSFGGIYLSESKSYNPNPNSSDNDFRQSSTEYSLLPSIKEEPIKEMNEIEFPDLESKPNKTEPGTPVNPSKSDSISGSEKSKGKKRHRNSLREKSEAKDHDHKPRRKSDHVHHHRRRSRTHHDSFSVTSSINQDSEDTSELAVPRSRMIPLPPNASSRSSFSKNSKDSNAQSSDKFSSSVLNSKHNSDSNPLLLDKLHSSSQPSSKEPIPPLSPTGVEKSPLSFEKDSSTFEKVLPDAIIVEKVSSPKSKEEKSSSAQKSKSKSKSKTTKKEEQKSKDLKPKEAKKHETKPVKEEEHKSPSKSVKEEDSKSHKHAKSKLPTPPRSFLDSQPANNDEVEKFEGRNLDESNSQQVVIAPAPPLSDAILNAIQTPQNYESSEEPLKIEQPPRKNSSSESYDSISNQIAVNNDINVKKIFNLVVDSETVKHKSSENNIETNSDGIRKISDSTRTNDEEIKNQFSSTKLKRSSGSNKSVRFQVLPTLPKTVTEDTSSTEEETEEYTVQDYNYMKEKVVFAEEPVNTSDSKPLLKSASTGEPSVEFVKPLIKSSSEKSDNVVIEENTVSSYEVQRPFTNDSSTSTGTIEGLRSHKNEEIMAYFTQKVPQASSTSASEKLMELPKHRGPMLDRRYHVSSDSDELSREIMKIYSSSSDPKKKLLMVEDKPVRNNFSVGSAKQSSDSSDSKNAKISKPNEKQSKKSDSSDSKNVKIVQKPPKISSDSEKEEKEFVQKPPNVSSSSEESSAKIPEQVKQFIQKKPHISEISSDSSSTSSMQLDEETIDPDHMILPQNVTVLNSHDKSESSELFIPEPVENRQRPKSSSTKEEESSSSDKLNEETILSEDMKPEMSPMSPKKVYSDSDEEKTPLKVNIPEEKEESDGPPTPKTPQVLVQKFNNDISISSEDEEESEKQKVVNQKPPQVSSENSDDEEKIALSKISDANIIQKKPPLSSYSSSPQVPFTQKKYVPSSDGESTYTSTSEATDPEERPNPFKPAMPSSISEQTTSYSEIPFPDPNLAENMGLSTGTDESTSVNEENNQQKVEANSSEAQKDNEEAATTRDLKFSSEESSDSMNEAEKLLLRKKNMVELQESMKREIEEAKKEDIKKEAKKGEKVPAKQEEKVEKENIKVVEEEPKQEVKEQKVAKKKVYKIIDNNSTSSSSEEIEKLQLSMPIEQIIQLNEEKKAEREEQKKQFKQKKPPMSSESSAAEQPDKHRTIHRPPPIPVNHDTKTEAKASKKSPTGKDTHSDGENKPRHVKQRKQQVEQSPLVEEKKTSSSDDSSTNGQISIFKSIKPRTFSSQYIDLSPRRTNINPINAGSSSPNLISKEKTVSSDNDEERQPMIFRPFRYNARKVKSQGEVTSVTTGGTSSPLDSPAIPESMRGPISVTEITESSFSSDYFTRRSKPTESSASPSTSMQKPPPNSSSDVPSSGKPASKIVDQIPEAENFVEDETSTLETDSMKSTESTDNQDLQIFVTKKFQRVNLQQSRNFAKSTDVLKIEEADEANEHKAKSNKYNFIKSPIGNIAINDEPRPKSMDFGRRPIRSIDLQNFAPPLYYDDTSKSRDETESKSFESDFSEDDHNKKKKNQVKFGIKQ